MANQTSFIAFRSIEFRWYVLTRFLFVFSTRLISTAIAYQLFQLTGSSWEIALLGLSEFIPVAFLALYAGVIVDKYDKKKIMITGLLAYVAVASAVWFVSQTSQFQTHEKVNLFYFLIFLTGIIRVFLSPSFSSSLAFTLPKEHLSFATNISTSVWLTGSIVGHATAGFLIAFVGVQQALLAPVVVLFLAFIASQMLRPKPSVGMQKTDKNWKAVGEGLHYVFHHKTLLSAMTLDLFAVLFGGVVALIPEVSEKILRVGPVEYGWLNAAMDIGSMISLFTIMVFPIKHQHGKKLILVVMGFGLCIIGFGLSKTFLLSFLCLMLAGMLDGVSMVIRGNIMQLLTPDEMRGRVSSISSIFINSSNELGQFESGLAYRLLGIIPSIIFGGTMTVLVATTTWFTTPKLKNFEYK